MLLLWYPIHVIEVATVVVTGTLLSERGRHERYPNK